MDAIALWERFKERLVLDASSGFALDISRINFDTAYLQRFEPHMQSAYQTMDLLEKGAMANPDENRMVGHYWLRDPHLAP